MTKKVFMLAILVFCVSISSIYASEKNIEKSANLQNNFPNIFRPIGDLVKRIFRKKPPVCLSSPPVDVTNVSLSKIEISEQDVSENKQIEVFTEIYNSIGETVIYDYQISSGTIIGHGSKVVWDLSNARVGIYTIIVRVDSGNGFDAGKSVTKTITIKP